jgi:pimeloyl-ACP methyl ester carboxylesterase
LKSFTGVISCNDFGDYCSVSGNGFSCVNFNAVGDLQQPTISMKLQDIPISPGNYPLVPGHIPSGTDLFAVFPHLAVCGGQDVSLALSSGSLNVTGNEPPGKLYLVDPFLLGVKNLEDIDLTSLVPRISNWETVAARGITADSTAAAIVLYQTTNRSDQVAFEVNNGASLVHYTSNFLKSPSSKGAAHLPVFPRSYGGHYYAVALVQAPGTTTSASFQTPITVTAIQGLSKRTQASVKLVAPPLILVHGIWGTRASLNSLYRHLTSLSPWKSSKVVEIQYTKYLAFDHPEPSKVLGSNIASLLGYLKSNHIAGRRVDVVAHSMGGLVARRYSRLPAYRSTENRQQVQFHQIVTIDTPEAGSELAVYLFGNRNSSAQTLLAPVTSLGVWKQACKSFSVTLGQCLLALDMRLAPPSGRLRDGAVYSLQPKSPNLQNLQAATDPNIRGAIWRAISAHVTPGKSLLRWELEKLIAASWPGYPKPPGRPKPAPTITAILQDGGQDDGIVTVKSQLAGAVAPDFVTLSGLSHSPASPTVVDAPLGLSDANVEDSDAVNTLVACWLTTGGSADCNRAHQTASAALSSSAPNAGTQLDPTRLHDADALFASLPPKPRLGSPFRFRVELPSANPSRLTLRQRDNFGHVAPVQTLAVGRAEGKTVYVEAAPMLLGSVTFGIDAVFQDGGISSRDFAATVGMPDADPEEFAGDANFRDIYLGLEAGSDVYELHPQAAYASAPDKVELDGRTVKYRVMPSDGPPAVKLEQSDPNDPTLVSIVALRPGRSAVEARFGGMLDRLTVTVEPRRN